MQLTDAHNATVDYIRILQMNGIELDGAYFDESTVNLDNDSSSLM